MTLDATHILLAALAWLSALAGSAVATRVYLRWHWAEITRAHRRLDSVEGRVTALEHTHRSIA